MDSFDARLSTLSHSRCALLPGRARRLVPVSKYNEYDEPVPTEAALGHLMMTAGIGNEQFFWCNICCAYTGDRVRKLAKQCDRVVRNVPAINLLRQDLHPVKGTKLDVPARRMLKADVSSNIQLLDAPPQSGQFGIMAIADGVACDLHTVNVDVVDHPQPYLFEDLCT